MSDQPRSTDPDHKPPTDLTDEVVESPLLVLETGGENVRTWRLVQPVTIIGRAKESDISLEDRRVSRRHARIERRNGDYLVSDLGSTNGSFVNGQMLTGELRLQNGDVLQIAPRFQLRFIDHTATIPISTPFGRLRLHIDYDSHSVRIGERAVELSASQFELLYLLASVNGRVLSREEIIGAVWPAEEAAGVTNQALDALVRRLRERLAEVDSDHNYVQTVRGHGFKFQNR
ncbi:MAG: FHA domain-containing protein [Anaerolineales bacterium]|nr:FHA domain-containing protein [Anaerolineales bacterium]MCB9127172.1 FHA domain-containing protein [Ardenticatenales bacterium]MCB9171932.1 FHA domain-containing protein [Ardenticatenales bacterium]